MDNEAFENFVQNDIVGRFIEGDYFKIFFMLVIISNSIMIGLETDAHLVVKLLLSIIIILLPSIHWMLFI